MSTRQRTSPTSCGRRPTSFSAIGSRPDTYRCGWWAWASAAWTTTGLAQGMLFDGDERQKQSQADAVADQIKERFGTGGFTEGEQPSGRKPQDAVASILRGSGNRPPDSRGRDQGASARLWRLSTGTIRPAADYPFGCTFRSPFRTQNRTQMAKKRQRPLVAAVS